MILKFEIQILQITVMTKVVTCFFISSFCFTIYPLTSFKEQENGKDEFHLKHGRVILAL